VDDECDKKRERINEPTTFPSDDWRGLGGRGLPGSIAGRDHWQFAEKSGVTFLARGEAGLSLLIWQNLMDR